MTYKGRGHIQVKVGLLSNTNTENNTAARQNHSDDRAAARQQGKATTLQNQKQKPWQQHGSKVIALATAWDSSITAIQN